MVIVTWLGFCAEARVEEEPDLFGDKRPVLHVSVPLKSSTLRYLNKDGALKRTTATLDWETLLAAVDRGCFTDNVWESVASDPRWAAWRKTRTVDDMRAALDGCLNTEWGDSE